MPYDFFVRILHEARVMQLVEEHGSLEVALCRADDVYDVSKLLMAGADPSLDDNNTICLAALNGNIAIVVPPSRETQRTDVRGHVGKRRETNAWLRKIRTPRRSILEVSSCVYDYAPVGVMEVVWV